MSNFGTLPIIINDLLAPYVTRVCYVINNYIKNTILKIKFLTKIIQITNLLMKVLFLQES